MYHIYKGKVYRVILSPNISVRQDEPSSGAAKS